MKRKKLRVKILKSDSRLGLEADEIYIAKRHIFDSEKIELIERESDGHCPRCTQYRYQVAFWKNNNWEIIV